MRMTRKVKPLIQIEQLEPRIMLSGDGLLNIAPDLNEDTILDNTSQVIQYVEDTHEPVEAELSLELAQPYTTNIDVYEPIITLLVDDDSTNDELVDSDLSVDNVDPTLVNDEINILSNDSDEYIENKVGTTEDSGIPDYIDDDLSIEYATSIEIRGPPVSETVLELSLSVEGARLGPYIVTGMLPSPPGGIGGLTFADGFLYSVEGYNGNIHKIDPQTGNVLGSYEVPGDSLHDNLPYDGPEGLAWDGVDFYMATRAPNWLRRLSLEVPPDVSVLSMHSLQDWYDWPMGLTFADGYLYYPEYLGSIRKVDPSTGSTVQTLPSPSDFVYAITYDGHNLLAAYGPGETTIWVISPETGDVLETWSTTGLSGTWGLAYDQDTSTLYIGSWSGIAVAEAVAIKGRVTDGQGHDLPYVAVTLNQEVWWNPTPWGRYNLTIYTDDTGYFKFPTMDAEGDELPAGQEDCTLRVDLKYRPEGVNFDLFEVLHDTESVYIQTEKFDPSLQSGDIILDFGNATSLTHNPAIDAGRHDDLALAYYYAAGLYGFIGGVLEPTDPGVPNLDLPLEIRLFSPDPNNYSAWYSPSDQEVRLSVPFSDTDDFPQPVCDVVQHEVFHYLMDATIEEGAYHGHWDWFTWVWDDENHGGFFNNHCTGDSWVEGYAEYWPCAVKTWLGEPNADRFSIFGSLDTQRTARNDEEFAVAGVLWDLTDPKGENGEDNIRVSFGTLWQIIGRSPVDQSGDGEVDMFDVYDALVGSLVGEPNVTDTGQNDGTTISLDDIDQLFVSHGFFADVNDNLIRDGGEEIGRAADQQRQDRRTPHPTIQAAYIKLNARDADGTPLTQGMVRIDYKYNAPWQEYDATELRLLSDPSGELVYLHPDPDRFSPTVTVSIEDHNGLVSDSISFTMADYRDLLDEEEGEYVIAHEFEIMATGQAFVTDVFVDPLPSNTDWFTAYIEVIPGEQPEDIDLTQVELLYANGEKLANPIVAASDPALPFVQNRQTTDHDGDGVPELLVRFPRAAVLAAVSTTEAGPVSVTIGWTDSTGYQREGTAFMNGTPAFEELNLSSSTIDENDIVTVVGSFNDPNLLDTHMLVINWGDGTIETTTLAVGIRDFSESHQYLDDEPTGTPLDDYTISATVSDNTGSNTVTTTVTVVNVAPSLADTTFELEENRPNGTVVGTASGTDPGDDTLTYSIVGGTGASAFAIDDSSGQITVSDATQLDYETTPSFTLEVQVVDDDNAANTATVTINLLNQASITGNVFVDVNTNGVYEVNEPGIDGITIELLDENGVPILDTQNNPVTATTSDGGFYLFEDIDPGTYQLREVQPTGVDDGVEILGSLGGTIPANDTMRLTLERIDATDYIFAELGQSVASGDTATIGFWQNKHGQALIRQGAAELADWLTNNFGNVFGDTFIGGDSDDVASFYRDQLFRQKSQKSAGPAKVDAQFMAMALATYFTSSNLAGNVASDYGFNVTDTGIGTKVMNVGDNGTAFGVASGSDLTIMQLLLATNDLTDQPDNLSGFARIYDLNGDGEIDEAEASLGRLANEVYSAINE